MKLYDMPLDFSMEETHDLFKLAEFVLLSPFDSGVTVGYHLKPGIRPGLVFSTGCDSTAAGVTSRTNSFDVSHEKWF